MNLISRPLGQSDLNITPVGIGTAPIGSTARWRIYWGPQDENQAIRAIEAALDLGVNWIDDEQFLMRCITVQSIPVSPYE